MQTPSLPIQVTGASASPNANRAKSGGADDGAQFSQALARQIGQRQDQEAAAPAGPAAGARPAAGEAAPAAKAKTDGKERAAEDSGTAPTSETAADDPVVAVVDMLALVASFNPPLASTAATGEAAADPAQGGSVRLPGLDRQAGMAAGPQLPLAGEALLAGQPAAAGAAGDGAAVSIAPANSRTVLSDMMARADGSMPDGLKRAAPDGAGAVPARRSVADAGAGAAQARAAGAEADAAGSAKGVSDLAQLASARTLEAAPEPAALNDMQVSAPASSPVQQASLGLAQSVNGPGPGDKIAARVGTPGWDNQVAQKIVWMVAGKEQSASLTLNPPDLGPMQVVLSVTNDQASVTFSAAQPEVRQALENAMPKLRDMMSESGIALGNATVNDGSAGQRQAQGEAARQGGANGRLDNGNGSAAQAEARVAARAPRGGERQGLVDTFA